MLYPNDSSTNIIKKTADQNAALLLPRPEVGLEVVAEEEAAPLVQPDNNNNSNNNNINNLDQNAALLLPRPVLRLEGVAEEEAAPPVQPDNNNTSNNTNNRELIVIEENTEETFMKLVETFRELVAKHGMKGYIKWSKMLVFDAGFGGVSMAVEFGKLGISVIIGIKQAHALFPKKEIELQMKDLPSGLWVILESVVDGVDLLAIGYKYNRRKTLFFCCTKGAGPTIPGAPYIAKFADQYRNRCTRAVERPVVISRYFHYANRIDMHNQKRQSILDLERTWATNDPWFRICTTIFGMTLVDTYLGCKATRGILTNHNLEKFIEDFSIILINYNEETISTVARQATQNLPGKRVSISPAVAGPRSKKAKVAQ